MEVIPEINQEISIEEQKKFIDALQKIPDAGIALRGDPLSRSDTLQQGLNEPQINYLVYIPPAERPKIWDKSAAEQYVKLKSMVAMSLVYTEPWYDTGVNTTIEDPDFIDFVDYYNKNPNKLPNITWFTESTDGQFKKVDEKGFLWFEDGVALKAGNVEKFGQISKDNIKPPVTATIEDIQEIQTKVSASLESEKLNRGLRQARKEIRKGLTEKMTAKLVDRFLLN